MMAGFADRQEAGEALARALEDYAAKPNALLLGLPRGGVPVAAPIAAALDLPLDVMLVAKLGVPGQRELAFGAIGLHGEPVFNPDIMAQVAIPQPTIDATIAEKQALLDDRNTLYRAGAGAPDLKGKTAILVDDGLATGATMRAAVAATRAAGAAQIVIAIPVGSVEACHALTPLCDKLVCLATPTPFWGVGHWYANFDQTSDQEVITLLNRYRGP